MQDASSAITVAPRVWRITVPLPGRPREVHAYLLESDAGFTLVDSGVDTPAAWMALDAGVREAAGEWSRVRTHVVTHMHMDHIGLAGRVREVCAATLVMSRLDAERFAHANAHPEEEAEYRERLLRECGAPDELLAAISVVRQQVADLVAPVAADELLDGDSGALPRVAGWSFVWTPGHTAGHISLFRAADRLLVAGDAVLPHITPTIGVNRQRSDPVGDYLAALDRLERLAPAAILPGHGEPVAEPLVRIRELRAVTRQESARVAACLADEPAPAWEITRRRYPGREMPAAIQMLALRETLAHLQHLVLSGGAASVPFGDGVVGFTRGRA